MNRRNIILIVAAMLMLPASLMVAHPHNKPPRPSCKDCKKCGRLCKCECSKGCKCRPGCCKSGQSPILDPRTRGFDGRTPSFRPPGSRPPSGFDRRTPNFRSPSRSHPSPDRGSRYKEIISKFDKNNDGKLDEKEREAVREYIKQRMSEG